MKIIRQLSLSDPSRLMNWYPIRGILRILSVTGQTQKLPLGDERNVIFLWYSPRSHGGHEEGLSAYGGLVVY